MSALVVWLATRLARLAVRYDAVADELRAAGGSWGLVVADELAATAARLRDRRLELVGDPSPELLEAAAADVNSATAILARIDARP